MTDDQRFMSQDDRPLSYLQLDESGEMVIPSDSFHAIRLVLAAADLDAKTMLEILQGRPALPLLGGLISLVTVLAEHLYGKGYRDRLDMLALVSDSESADEFRRQRRAS